MIVEIMASRLCIFKNEIPLWRKPMIHTNKTLSKLKELDNSKIIFIARIILTHAMTLIIIKPNYVD